jgi:hypothetical protein
MRNLTRAEEVKAEIGEVTWEDLEELKTGHFFHREMTLFFEYYVNMGGVGCRVHVDV